MVIEKGREWGRVVERPHDLRTVADDAALASAVTDGSGRPTALLAGDLHRTIGGREVHGLSEVLELPIDLLNVVLDDGVERRACAHVLVQNPAHRGGWWRGDVVMVMNAEFIGEWHVVARGHPNDGRAESCSWGQGFGIRQRLEARRRLPAGSHVPHPQIETRSFRTRDWRFARPMDIIIDGRPAGRSESLHIDVLVDAAVIYG